MSTFPSNAQAGPSSPRTSLPDLFLPPQGPPPLTQHLASTQDLLARFHLLPAYDKYVRPFATQYSDDGQIRSTPAPDKGKGKQVDSGITPLQQRTLGGSGPPGADAPDAEDDDAGGGKGERKKKNTYKALIKGIPGKHSMKKDDYLAKMVMEPPKQRARIHPFDARTQQEAFAVSLDGLKYWNANTLILESAQAREDRKKRKELKRLAKAQQAQAAAAAAVMQAGGAGTTPVVAQPQPIRAGGGIPDTGSSATPQTQQPSASTPKSVGTPRPISTVPRPGSTVPRPGSAVPRPGSTVPRPTSTAPTNIKQETKPPVLPLQVPPTMVATPSRTATTTPTSADPSRGKKREREHLVTPLNGVPPDSHSNPGMNGVTNGTTTTNGVPKIHAKAGVMGVHPRPVKKQRMDMQGQARDVSAPVQQPTPQGV